MTVALKDVSKQFGAVQALDGVSLRIDRGTIHGLLGQNGSGKSTVIKTLAGLHTPDTGSMEIDGRPVDLPFSPAAVHTLGFSFVHQDLALVPGLTVAENLLLAQISRRSGLSRWSDRALASEASQILERAGLDLDVHRRVSDLPAVDQSMLAIARAVATTGGAPRLLVLDEPTVFLPRAEVARLFEFVRSIAAQGGAVLFVSHDLDEVKEVTDQYTVLRDGKVVGAGTTAEVSRQDLVRQITGFAGSAAGVPRGVPHRLDEDAPVLSLRRYRTAAGELDLDIRGGEVVGVSGLAGSGFEDVPYAIFGARHDAAGELVVDGSLHPLASWTVRNAMRSGISLVPGNRAADGLVTTLSARENILVPVLGRYWRGVFDRRRSKADASRIFEDLEVRPHDVDLPVSSFSGGNAQKVLMGKWLQLEPRFLVVHEPSQGVDVGARRQIVATLRDQATRGCGIAVFSTDAEQLADLCDRVVVLHRDRHRRASWK